MVDVNIYVAIPIIRVRFLHNTRCPVSSFKLIKKQKRKRKLLRKLLNSNINIKKHKPSRNTKKILAKHLERLCSGFNELEMFSYNNKTQNEQNLFMSFFFCFVVTKDLFVFKNIISKRLFSYSLGHKSFSFGKTQKKYVQKYFRPPSSTHVRRITMPILACKTLKTKNWHSFENKLHGDDVKQHNVTTFKSN